MKACRGFFAHSDPSLRVVVPLLASHPYSPVIRSVAGDSVVTGVGGCGRPWMGPMPKGPAKAPSLGPQL